MGDSRVIPLSPAIYKKKRAFTFYLSFFLSIYFSFYTYPIH